jgi:hypothetical protein
MGIDTAITNCCHRPRCQSVDPSFHALPEAPRDVADYEKRDAEILQEVCLLARKSTRKF